MNINEEYEFKVVKVVKREFQGMYIAGCILYTLCLLYVNIYVHMYVYMYVYMYVCMYVCVYVCKYVCTYVRM